MLHVLRLSTKSNLRFRLLLLVGLPLFIALVFVLGGAKSNITADGGSLIDENTATLTVVKTGLEQNEIPVSIAGNQECFYDQKFVSRPEKRITPLNRFGQKEVSYTSCGTDTLYGTRDQTGALTRSGTNISGPVYYLPEQYGSQTKFPFLPIPNSDSFFEYIKKPTTGGYIKLHKNISQKIETEVVSKTGEVRHYFTRSGGEFIVDRNGNNITKNFGENYSPSGQWMVFDSNLGLMRLDVDTGDYLIFDERYTGTSFGGPGYDFAVSNDGRYAAVIKTKSKSAKLYDLSACLGDKTLDKPLDCDFLDLRKFADNKSGVAESTLLRPVFSDDNTLKFYRGWVKENGEAERQINLLSVGEPVLFNYLGLGDSFASGEGAYDYKPGTDVASPFNKCHVSLNSYPLLLGQELGLSSYESIACSGAKIQDINFPLVDKYNRDLSQSKGKTDKIFNPEIYNNFLPGYRVQERFVEEYLPRNITISVGGNDIGFSSIIGQCVSLPEDCLSKPRERADLAKLINDQYASLVETYSRLGEASAGGTTNVIGYPQIISEDGACAANARLSHEELTVATQLIKYLNSVIEKAAKRAGAVYVDASEALSGHRLCESGNNALAVNGLTNGDDKFFDIGPIANESYHPNYLGQKLIEKKILEKTNGLTMVNPDPDLSIADPKIEDASDLTGLDIIDFNQPIFDIIDMTAPVWSHGLLSSVSSSGFAPGSDVTAWITSEPYELGQFSANESGEINFSFGLSDEVPFGFHTLHLSGINVAGEEIEQLQQIYFAYSEDDFDGNGILNEDEVCLVGEPTGIDVDQDGFDDACDGLVGEPPEEEIRQIPDEGQLPEFETFPDSKPPENNPETVAGDEPEPDTISGVNPSTNQAPGNSSSLQPNAGQPQNAGGNLQTGSTVPTGGNTAVNSLLNQGAVPSKPLSVGVAGASTESSTAPAPINTEQADDGGFSLPALIVFLIIILIVGFIITAARKPRFQPDATDEPAEKYPDSVVTPLVAQVEKPKKLKKKKRKKPNHH